MDWPAVSVIWTILRRVAVDHSLVWDINNPTATSAKGFDGRMHNKVRATVGCVNDLKVIYGWSEAPFDASYYKDHEFVAGDIEELSKHGRVSFWATVTYSSRWILL